MFDTETCRGIADDGDDIETQFFEIFVSDDIGIGSLAQPGHLLAVDGKHRVEHLIGVACLHFDEGKCEAIGRECDNIYLIMAEAPVLFANDVSLSDKVVDGHLFAPSSCFVVLCHLKCMCSQKYKLLLFVPKENYNFAFKTDGMMERPTEANSDELFMRKAMQEAAAAEERGEVPIGAVVVCQGKVIARAHNLTETLHDVTAHAEMQAITSATDALGGKYLTDCTLYVTVEPCVMCAGALGWAQISRLVYGTGDEKRGYKRYAPDALHPKTTVTSGVMEEECRTRLQQFFKQKR